MKVQLLFGVLFTTFLKLIGKTGVILIFSELTENLACATNSVSSQQLLTTTETSETSATVGITWGDAPELQYAVLGQNYKIRCVVKANSDPIVDWFKNGEKVNMAANHRYIIENTGVIIKNVKESDEGVYTCRAAVLKTGQLQTKNIKVEVLIVPRIYPMQTIEVVDGEEASAVCNGTGKPSPSYTWVKENTNEDLAYNDRFTVKKYSGLVIIHKVELNDNSYYKCIAQNAAGQAETRVKINVLVKPKIYELYNITAPIEYKTKIICKAVGRPAPKIIFRKLSKHEPYDDGPQQYDARILQENYPNEERGETVGTLSFSRLNRTDDGLYECIAENKLKTSHKNGHITVEFPPTFQKANNYSPVWSWYNQPGNLTCSPEAIPNATIEWRFNGINIENDKSPNIQQYGYGPWSYLIVKPYNEPRFFAMYDCIATNKLGQATKKLKLQKATVPQHIQQAKPESITDTTITFGIVGPPDRHGLPLKSIVVEYQTERDRSWDTAKEHIWSYNATYILENLIPEETYNFRFAARNDVGQGEWAANQQIKMTRRSVPAEPKLILEGQILDNNYVAADIVATSHYADHYRLQWTIPNDNGDPIDSYTIRFCVTRKVNEEWRDSESTTEIIQGALHTAFDMNSLRPNTTYKVEVRAHNGIGLSSPAEIRVQTASVLTSHKEYSNSAFRNELSLISSFISIFLLVCVF